MAKFLKGGEFWDLGLMIWVNSYIVAAALDTCTIMTWQRSSSQRLRGATAGLYSEKTGRAAKWGPAGSDIIMLCVVSGQGDRSEFRGVFGPVISWLNGYVCVSVCVCVCFCLAGCVSLSQRECSCVSMFWCVCVCVCVCVWRISVPLQSSGCNQTGHWLHDVPQPPPPPTAGAPLSLSPCHVCLAAGLGTLAVC